jgi:hypothetical protein
LNNSGVIPGKLAIPKEEARPDIQDNFKNFSIPASAGMTVAVFAHLFYELYFQDTKITCRK